MSFCNQTVIDRINKKRASRRDECLRTVSDVNKLINSEQFDLSELHVLHGQLHALEAELSALNTGLETFMTDEQVAEDYNSVLEYEDAAIGALALLEHHMDLLNVSPPPWVFQLQQLTGAN